MAAHRSGGWFDPDLVAALQRFRDDWAFWGALEEPDLSAWEPADRHLAADEPPCADEAYLDRIADAFAGVVDAKSPWTYRHSDRTCVIAMSIAALLGCDEAILGDMRRAALLHDVGKLAISNRILDKPARLTDAEFARVRQHPLFTQWILERVPGFRDLAPLAGAHHERLDGRGYPHGLAGRQLSVPMRVLAVADVYEALTSERPYRPAMSSAQALDEMRLEVPGRLDGDAFAALVAVLEARAPALRGAARTGLAVRGLRRRSRRRRGRRPAEHGARRVNRSLSHARDLLRGSAGDGLTAPRRAKTHVFSAT